MDSIQNDTLGFEQFKIDERLSSLLSQILGAYARLTFKVKQQLNDDSRSSEYQRRFDEIAKIKSEVRHYSYPRKMEEIQKIREELLEILSKERKLD